MKYPFEVYRAVNEGNVFWVARSKVLNDCAGQGDSIEEACDELESNEKEWLEAAAEYGFDIPEIPTESLVQNSGKFTVRVSPQTHRVAVRQAEKQGISLNQYVNDAIVWANAQNDCVEGIMPIVKEQFDKVAKWYSDVAELNRHGESGLKLATRTTKEMWGERANAEVNFS